MKRILALLLVCPQLVQAATYYVAKTGRDTNAGSLTAPFLTIRKGLSALRSGDTLTIRAGTYAESIVNGAPSGSSWGTATTVTAFPGERVVLAPTSGARVVDFSDRRYVVLDGLVLDGRSVSYNGVKISGSADYIRVRNGEVLNAPSQGILVSPGADGNEFINLKVHDNGDTEKNHGLYINSSNNLIEGCDVYRNGGGGLHIYTGYAGQTASRNVIRYSKFHDNARAGGRGVGIGLTSGSDNVAHNNLVWNNATGVQIDYSSIRTKVYNNTIYKNRGYGLYVGRGTGANQGGASSGADVRNNIVFGNGSGIQNVQPGAVVSNNLTTDPQFVSAAGFDLRLRSGSPAIDKGANLSGEGITRDIAGAPRPQGAAFDIGAYELGGAVTAPPPPTTTTPTGGCVDAVAYVWKNISLPAQTGTFTAIFEAKPTANRMDSVVGLSNGPASAWTALAAAVRFAETGRIDARNGGTYTAAASIPYAAGQTYRVRLVVNLAAKTYTAYVNDQLLGSNYAFRTEQRTATTLSNVGIGTTVGGVSVCNAAVAAASDDQTADVTPPTIGAVTVSAISGAGATVSWTTNEPADTQVEYGPTTSYGSSSPLNATRSTSHGVTLTGLASGTLYHYRVKSKDAAGNLATSADRTFSTAAGASCVSSANVWRNVSLPARTGSFTVEFDARPGGSAVDGVLGVSNGPANSYSALAAAVRFNNAGRIDARSGGSYTAAGSISYRANVTYRFRLVINVSTRTYSAYVREGTGSEKLIGSNYRFRTEQAGVSRLNNLGLMSSIGTTTVCNAAAR